MDFNASRLHEVTLNIHMYAWIFSRLSIASVDGKQHLSEIVFSALVGFSLATGIWFPGRTRTPRTRDQWLWCSWSRGHCCGVQHVLWDFNKKMLLRCSRRSVIFLTMKIRESTTHYLTQTLLTINWRNWQAGKNSRMRMKVNGHLMQARFTEIHQV